MGENRRGFLVGTNHVDRAVERALVDTLTTLGEHHEFLEQGGRNRRVRPRHVDFVATNRDVGLRQGLLDAAQMPIVLAQQGTHQVVSGDSDGDGRRSHG